MARSLYLKMAASSLRIGGSVNIFPGLLNAHVIVFAGEPSIQSRNIDPAV